LYAGVFVENLISAAVRRVESWDDDRWRRLVVTYAVAAFAIRGVLALGGLGDSADLSIYVYFGRFVANGINPYHVPPLPSAGGAIADEPVFEFVLYAGLLRMWDSPITLRLFFAACDAATIMALGLLLPRTRRWRLGAMTFLGFNPLPLVAWTYIPEDKSLVLLLLVVTMAAAELSRDGIAWITTGLLAAVKWMGPFFAVPLLVDGIRRTGRKALWPAIAGGTIAVLSMLPFFPDSLLTLVRRSDRFNARPMFDSITIVLADLHIYHPALLRVWLVVAFAVVAVLHAREAIDVGEAIALGSAAMFVFLPDEPADRILLVSMVLMLVTRPRWRTWWTISFIPTVWVFADYTFGAHHPLRRIIGPPESWQHVLPANLLLLALVSSYWVDRMRGVGREPVWPASVQGRLERVVEVGTSPKQ
jgi:hypothetical protein